MALSMQTVRFGRFQSDLRAAELRHNGTKIKLPEQPFQVLCELVERPGEVVTREELRQRGSGPLAGKGVSRTRLVSCFAQGGTSPLKSCARIPASRICSGA